MPIIYDDPHPPIQLRDYPGTDLYTHHVTALFSMKELVGMAQREILPTVISRLAPHVEQAVFSALMDEKKLEAYIVECFKDEIRKQVQEAVQARLDDFIEEAIGS